MGEVVAGRPRRRTRSPRRRAPYRAPRAPASHRGPLLSDALPHPPGSCASVCSSACVDRHREPSVLPGLQGRAPGACHHFVSISQRGAYPTLSAGTAVRWPANPSGGGEPGCRENGKFRSHHPRRCRGCGGRSPCGGHGWYGVRQEHQRNKDQRCGQHLRRPARVESGRARGPVSSSASQLNYSPVGSGGGVSAITNKQGGLRRERRAALASSHRDLLHVCVQIPWALVGNWR